MISNYKGARRRLAEGRKQMCVIFRVPFPGSMLAGTAAKRVVQASLKIASSDARNYK
jgi:hypothetical protein